MSHYHIEKIDIQTFRGLDKQFTRQEAILGGILREYKVSDRVKIKARIYDEKPMEIVKLTLKAEFGWAVNGKCHSRKIDAEVECINIMTAGGAYSLSPCKKVGEKIELLA